jgi:O-antigen/teichoic acid export membrane protein
MVDPNTRRNVISYYLNFIVVALAGLVVNPLLLGAFGPVMFGLWRSLQRYLDFATLADGRASQALKWIVANRNGQTDRERRRDVAAAIIVWFRWLPAVILVAAGVTLSIPLLINGIPDNMRPLAYGTAAILAANTVLFGLLSIPDSVLVGVNQGYRSMTITTLAYVGSNAAMVGAAFAGWPLWSLALIVLVAAVINALLTLFVAKRNVSWWGLTRPTKADLRRVFGYSSWTLGSGVVDKLFVSSELIVISVMIDAVAVTRYTFTSYVMQFVLSIALVTASGFMPMLGSQLGVAEIDAAAERARSVRHLVIGLAALGSGAVLAFNGAFVTFWVGGDQYLGTVLNALLVVCGLQFVLIRMDGQILDVTMRIAPKVLVGLLTSLGGIVAGCIGFAIAHNLAVGLVAVILVRLVGNVVYPVLVARSIPGAAVARRPIVLAGAIIGLSLGIGPLSQSAEPLTIACLAAGWLLLSGAAAWSGLVPRATMRALFSRQRLDQLKSPK